MNDTSKSSQLIAHLLLKNKAIQLRPDNMFQWSSGMLSPIYCDNRILLSDHEARSAVKNAFVLCWKTITLRALQVLLPLG